MKQTYQTPTIEIIEVANEGIIAASTHRLPNRPWSKNATDPIEIEPMMPADDELMA